MGAIALVGVTNDVCFEDRDDAVVFPATLDEIPIPGGGIGETEEGIAEDQAGASFVLYTGAALF